MYNGMNLHIWLLRASNMLSPFGCEKLDAAATTSNLQVQPAPMMHHDKLCLSGLYIFSKKEGIMLTMI